MKNNSAVDDRVAEYSFVATSEADLKSVERYFSEKNYGKIIKKKILLDEGEKYIYCTYVKNNNLRNSAIRG